ncbi:hypothetical protein VPH35_006404 [Triticum aestivum]
MSVRPTRREPRAAGDLSAIARSRPKRGPGGGAASFPGRDTAGSMRGTPAQAQIGFIDPPYVIDAGRHDGKPSVRVHHRRSRHEHGGNLGWIGPAVRVSLFSHAYTGAAPIFRTSRHLQQPRSRSREGSRAHISNNPDTDHGRALSSAPSTSPRILHYADAPASHTCTARPVHGHATIELQPD